MTRSLYDRVGFSRPQRVKDGAEKGACLHWIMTATLAICTIVAATMISIGIARAIQQQADVPVPSAAVRPASTTPAGMSTICKQPSAGLRADA